MCLTQTCVSTAAATATDHSTTNATKYRKMPYLVMLRKVKKCLDPHPELAQHQNLLTSRGSPFLHVYQVWSTSITTFVSYVADRWTYNIYAQTHTHTYDHNTCFISVHRGIQLKMHYVRSVIKCKTQLLQEPPSQSKCNK